MAEMPAAPPHASRRMRFSWFRSRLRATLLPIAAPVCATGASSPADTPNPTLTPLVMICENVLWRGTAPVRFFTLMMTPARPRSYLPRMTTCATKIQKNTPSAGVAGSTQTAHPASAGIDATSDCTRCSTIFISAPATPDSRPTSTLSRMM